MPINEMMKFLKTSTRLAFDSIRKIIMWFTKKKIKIKITDSRLAERVRKYGPEILEFMDQFPEHADTAARFSPEIKETIEYVGIDNFTNGVKCQTRRCFKELHHLINRHNILYRTINPDEYKLFLRDGNTKTPENISRAEREHLKKLNIDPSEVMFASPHLGKAWEYSDKHPSTSIVIVYDQSAFMRPKHEADLWQIKPGHSFKKAVEAYIIIRYP